MKQKETKEIHQTKEKNDINGIHNPGEGNEGREIPIPNREYKSTVFAMLYRDKERPLSWRLQSVYGKGYWQSFWKPTEGR